ncbi:MAG: TonB family protein [Gammaproteobacteria bacterium]
MAAGESARQAVNAPNSHFGFGLLCAVVSLTFHAVLAMEVMGLNRSRPAPPQREQLVVELVGIVSDRQVERKQLGAPDARTISKPLPPEMAKKAQAPVRKAPSSVKVKEKPRKPETKPKPEERPVQQVAATPASEQTMPKGADVQQVQQALKIRETEASLLRKYLAGLKQVIQNHLEYPSEARDIGYLGAPVIRFTITESGDILPGSLCVQKSSSSTLLDEKALLAARAAAPMAKPPRQMTVTITVAFTQDG